MQKLRVLSLFLPLGLATAALAQVDPGLYSGLVWRDIGPFRGGRVASVTGAIGQPGVFYMGMPTGGVWKTTSAGTTWFPVFDSVKDVASVGSIQVAPSDPNIVYAGTGDMPTGGNINEGNGVYKSTDAGKTWEHLGLDASKQIPSILVDPHDPNTVLAATQGSLREKSETRGIFRTTDGGKTWKKVLYVDDQTGVEKMAWAYDNPSVIIATTDRHYYAPGASRFGGGRGGPGGNQGPTGTALYKSTDEGQTWTEVKGEGLPTLSGRTCVAIAMHTNSQRMFVVSNAGLYRSEDGGAHWDQMDATDRRVANGQGGYNCGVYVNSADPNIVYVINTSSYISKDGGKTFTGFKGAPGGDDPQQMWVDPTDGNRLFLGTDQGGTVSLDGGQNWSQWYNQPTAQVYHISTDNQFPYWVYATQQDSGSIATASRGNLGAITPLDWLPHPGYEFGSIVADPINPKISYAGGPGGGIVKVTYPSGQWINVSPSADSTARLRKVGNQPLLFSPTNKHELLAGFQYLMATTDGGMHWKKLSPDLGFPKGYVPPKEPAPATRPTNPPAKPDASGPKPPPVQTAPKKGGSGNRIDADDDSVMIESDKDAGQDMDGDDDDDQQGQGPQGGSIESFSPSTVDGGVIWVGTNNGLLKITKDHGHTWDDVTIPGLANPTRADISAIDSSHQDPATAYVAIDYHNSGDLQPFVYRTHDFGKTWTKIVTGLPTNLPSGSFARVVRADTKKQGLLYLGTESSVYVSFDDGDQWQPLTLNLPNTSYRDMVVHDNDLVVGTYGRGFWILDDIAPLRQITPTTNTEEAHLFQPSDAWRIRRNVNEDTPFPPEVPHAENPPLGAVIYYYLQSTPKSPIKLEVSDASGNVIRHMSSDPVKPLSELQPVPDFWLERPKPMPTEPGTNRINWNLRYDSPWAFAHTYEINANPGETPSSPEGPLVVPGVYTITLTVDGKEYKQNVTVKNDPRSPASFADIKAQHELQMRLLDCSKLSFDAYHQVALMRNDIGAIQDSEPSDDIAQACSDFDAKLVAVQGRTGGGRRGFGGFRGGPRVPSFVGVNGTVASQINELDSGDMAPNEALRKACDTVCGEMKTAMATWQNLNGKDLATLNALLTKSKIKPIAARVQVTDKRVAQTDTNKGAQ
ncbi:MAG TPA: hypothetical protein VGL56_09065 [Fimbriimonadaceae bacterium]|jgi:photosystem II stability/assembly factor-like uncharacterized protein